jgi:hypothetical protein
VYAVQVLVRAGDSVDMVPVDFILDVHAAADAMRLPPAPKVHIGDGASVSGVGENVRVVGGVSFQMTIVGVVGAHDVDQRVVVLSTRLPGGATLSECNEGSVDVDGMQMATEGTCTVVFTWTPPVLVEEAFTAQTLPIWFVVVSTVGQSVPQVRYLVNAPPADIEVYAALLPKGGVDSGAFVRPAATVTQLIDVGSLLVDVDDAVLTATETRTGKQVFTIVNTGTGELDVARIVLLDAPRALAVAIDGSLPRSLPANGRMTFSVHSAYEFDAERDVEALHASKESVNSGGKAVSLPCSFDGIVQISTNVQTADKSEFLFAVRMKVKTQRTLMREPAPPPIVPPGDGTNASPWMFVCIAAFLALIVGFGGGCVAARIGCCCIPGLAKDTRRKSGLIALTDDF